jgi:hypothetical protein
VELRLVEHIGLPRPHPVDSGWSQVVSRGPRTLSEVLRDASAAMDEEDRRQAMAADPLVYARPRGCRASLWRRLLGR